MLPLTTLCCCFQKFDSRASWRLARYNDPTSSTGRWLHGGDIIRVMDVEREVRVLTHCVPL